MTKLYRGYDAERGHWEQFAWDEKHEPTTEETGYDKIEEVEQDN